MLFAFSTASSGRAEGEHGEHRAEDLLLRDPVALRDLGEHGRREPPALLGEDGTAAGRSPRPPPRPLVDERLDPLELLLRVDRADVGVLVQRIADAQRAHAALQLRDDVLEDRLLHEQPRAGAAHVALVEVDPVDDPLDRLVERGVVEDDVRRLAAQLERQPLARAGDRALDLLADLGRAGERDLVDVRVLDERGARAAVAGDDVDDARRAARPGGARRRRGAP